MTMARSLVHNAPIHVLFPEEQGDNETPTLKYYDVLLYKTVGRGQGRGQFFIGHVVSHLSIQDWCDMHGYFLDTVYPTTRWAKPGERTDLF